VQRGDTLWGLAVHYYGTGTRWRVLRAANFTNDAAFAVYPLRSGMRLRIPAFAMKKVPQQSGPTNRGQPNRSETNRTSSAADARR
jgi:predicted P-loop ATPase